MAAFVVYDRAFVLWFEAPPSLSACLVWHPPMNAANAVGLVGFDGDDAPWENL